MPSPEITQLVRQFFDGISCGEVPDQLLTPDMTFWSVNSGEADKARFLGGIKVLAQIANKSIQYTFVSLTAEDDRVVAEITSKGTLISGESISNNHVFLLRLRDGKIASAAEYMNQKVVQEKIVPLMQELMAKAAK